VSHFTHKVPEYLLGLISYCEMRGSHCCVAEDSTFWHVMLQLVKVATSFQSQYLHLQGQVLQEELTVLMAHIQ